jgi:hypothetical protein
MALRFPGLARFVLFAAALGWSTAVFALEPFIAHYDVFRNGAKLGEATMQLSNTTGERWRIDLTMRGTGLMRIAGINAEQSTVFDTVGDTYRPLSQATLRRAVFTRRQTTGVYDWSARQARWQGDVRKTRRAPVPLQPGDMSGLLINLAVIRDAQPGRMLDYRFVDDGRAREHRYAVAAEPEPVTVDGMGYSALRVTRVQGGADETTIWVVDGVPTPVRLLQRENGEDTYDLRLTEYRGNE